MCIWWYDKSDTENASKYKAVVLLKPKANTNKVEVFNCWKLVKTVELVLSYMAYAYSRSNPKILVVF